MEQIGWEKVSGPTRIEAVRDSIASAFSRWVAVIETLEDHFICEVSGARDDNFAKFTQYLERIDAHYEVLEQRESEEYDNWPTYKLKITLKNE